MEAFVIFSGFALLVILLLSPFIVGLITTANKLKHEDPENFSWKAVWKANFLFDENSYKIELREKVVQRFGEDSVMSKLVNLQHNVLKLNTAIVIDKNNQKLMCIYNKKMPVLDFYEITGTMIVEEDEGQIYVLIYTRNELFPEISINVYDRTSAEGLIKTLNDVRASAQNNLYSKYE